MVRTASLPSSTSSNTSPKLSGKDLSHLSAREIFRMKKHILIYGLCGGVLILVLKLVEYRFLVVEHSIEIYGGLIALLFAVLGIWLGLKLTKNKETIVVREIPAPQSFTLNEARL